MVLMDHSSAPPRRPLRTRNAGALAGDRERRCTGDAGETRRRGRGPEGGRDVLTETAETAHAQLLGHPVVTWLNDPNRAHVIKYDTILIPS